MKRERYPEDWESISLAIRERAEAREPRPAMKHGAWMYDRGIALRRMSPTELAELDAHHRAEGYGAEPSAEAMLGAISACEPVPYEGELVTCSCGARMPARLVAECEARAADPTVWSLHRERGGPVVARARASGGERG